MIPSTVISQGFRCVGRPDGGGSGAAAAITRSEGS